MENLEIIQNEKAPYTLRKLCSKDIFPMVSIISKIGINEFANAFEADSVKSAIKNLVDAKTSETADKENLAAKNDENLTMMGISVALELANIIISHLCDCEAEIYLFLSGVSGMSVNELKELDIDIFLQMIIDVFKKEEFKGFIKVVSKFTK